MSCQPRDKHPLIILLIYKSFICKTLHGGPLIAPMFVRFLVSVSAVIQLDNLHCFTSEVLNPNERLAAKFDGYNLPLKWWRLEVIGEIIRMHYGPVGLRSGQIKRLFHGRFYKRLVRLKCKRIIAYFL